MTPLSMGIVSAMVFIPIVLLIFSRATITTQKRIITNLQNKIDNQLPRLSEWGMYGVDDAVHRCADAWIAAFSSNPSSLAAWCCHHELEYEAINSVSHAISRIVYICTYKPRHEIFTRLENFRPASATLSTIIRMTDAEVAALHRKDVPTHTWNGHSIFPDEYPY